MNKKGIYQQYMLIMVVFIALATIMLVFWGLSAIVPTGASLVKDLTSEVSGMVVSTGDQNLTNAISPQLNAIDSTVNNFEWVIYMLLICSFIGFIALCFYVRTYPFLIFFWIFGMIIMVVISLFITNAYQSQTGGDDYIATASKAWTSNHYLMSNLPIIFVGVGVLGGIVLFILISKDPEAEAVGI